MAKSQRRRSDAAHPADPADVLYAEPQPLVADFSFGAETTAVFDDMLLRSVPFYDELQRMIGELAADFAIDGSNVYDLGCATGTTMRTLCALPQDVVCIGVDNSAAMLARAELELQQANPPRSYVLRNEDIDRPVAIENASVVVMCLTLQFVRPLHRQRVLQAIYDGLAPQGCLLLIEKVLEEHTLTNRLFIKHYYDFKRRNGYAEIEIAQKREALENVLIPYRLEENRALLRAVGFHRPEIFFKWYNFCGFLAVR